MNAFYERKNIKMKDCLFAFMLAISLLLVIALHAFAVDGIAVSTQYRGVWDAAGDIFRYDIKNSAVASANKIFAKTTRVSARFPSINKEGTQIAFFRMTTDSGWFVSVMNIDGSGARNLARIPQGQDYSGTGFLYWPTGRWIYYMQNGDNHREGARHLWRVNVDNLQNAEVVRFQYPLWQFGMSADATKMHVRVYEDNGTFISLFSYLLPGDGSLPDASRIGNGAGCGSNLSPSGNELGYLQGGGHTWVAMASWATRTKENGDFGFATEKINSLVLPSSQQVTHCTWSDGTPITLTAGYGMDSNRWSANSDKWMCIQMGWIEQPGGSGRYSFCSSNQVLFNWVDSVAINASQNKRACADGANFASGCDIALPYSEYRKNDAGDFLVTAPLSDVNADLRGYLAPAASQFPRAHGSPDFSAVRSSRGLRVAIAVPGTFAVSVADVMGKIVQRQLVKGPGAACVAMHGSPCGVRYVMITGDGKAARTNIFYVK
jgi:hypothetical protein